MIITNERLSQTFVDCFNLAGSQIQRAAKSVGILFWLKKTPLGPYLEHLSFRIGSELYFVRIVDIDDRKEFPGTVNGLLRIAQGNRSHACYFPVRHVTETDTWESVFDGWGLVDALTGNRVDPALDLKEQRVVEMTDWELHDLAVQIVRDDLIKKGYIIESSLNDPAVNPSIWFREKDAGPASMQYVVVRACRNNLAPIASMNLDAATSKLTARGFKGHYAEVIMNSDQDGHLYRGRRTNYQYDGLKPIPKLN